METIKNYLESMFRGLPQTEKIMKAKSELLQMMEDKYTELIRSGKTENEAVGEVIQNFGNLDDLAEDLGIKDILHQTKISEVQRRKLSFEEVTEYLEAKKKAILMRALGILFFIIASSGPILGDAFRMNDFIGVIIMFSCIGCGIVLMVMSNSNTEQWRFIRREPCSIDAVSIDYLKNKLRDFTPTFSVLSSVGVLLCVLCCMPPIVLSEIGGRIMDEVGAAMIFYFVGAGVFMIVFAHSTKKTYIRLININENEVFGDNINMDGKIQNPRIKSLMGAYWSVVTCIYLCVSFLTFHWELTWLIWPIAAAVLSVLKCIYTTKDSGSKN